VKPGIPNLIKIFREISEVKLEVV